MFGPVDLEKIGLRKDIGMGWTYMYIAIVEVNFDFYPSLLLIEIAHASLLRPDFYNPGKSLINCIQAIYSFQL